MPSNMSFSHTTDQIINRTKTVTRRLGWRKLRPGQRVWAVKKAMGLRPGEKIERLALLEMVSNRREALLDVTEEDIAREGFPGTNSETFIGLFLRINPTMTRFQRVSRIEFKYIAEENDSKRPWDTDDIGYAGVAYRYSEPTDDGARRA